MGGVDTGSFEVWRKQGRNLAKRLALGDDFRLRKQADVRLEALNASLRLWREYQLHYGGEASAPDKTA